MKLNSLILGLVLVLGGCEAEMSDLGKTSSETETRTTTTTLTGIRTNTQTTSQTNTNTTMTTIGTNTQSTNQTNVNTNTSGSIVTNTRTSVATSTVNTWTRTLYTLEIQTDTLTGYGYTTGFRTSVLTTQTVTYTGVDIPTATRTMSMAGGVATVTVTLNTTQTKTSVATFVRPVRVENPCYTSNSACYSIVSQPGAPARVFGTCGWDVAGNACYSTPWCEPSVSSVGQNGIQPGLPFQAPVYQRPASAKCGAGQKSYTYNPGELFLWGESVTDSIYTVGGGPTDHSYLCVPNEQFVTINC